MTSPLTDLVERSRREPPHRDDARREALRARVLGAADVAASRPSRAPWLIAGVSLAAAAAALIALARRDDRPAPAPDRVAAAAIAAAAAAPAPAPADVAAVGPADYDRVATPGADVVHLRAGRIRIAAPSTTHILVGTTSVEADGAYEIAASHGDLAEVTVVHGHAAIRVSGATPVFLAAGETWHAPIVTATVTPPPPAIAPPQAIAPTQAIAPHAITPPPRTTPHASTAPTRTPSRAVEPPPSPAVSASAAGAGSGSDAAPTAASAPPPTETEQHFSTGWSLLRAGHFADAATQLAAAVDADPTSPLAEDARYFEAVALARAGRPADAEHVLTTFLSLAPRSLRRGRASVMLGWLLAQRGERDAARARFTDAEGDPDAQVAASARAGLAALDAP